MRVLDLFCGRWGWSRAFAARGWECVGVDLVIPPEFPDCCIFHPADILGVTCDDGAFHIPFDDGTERTFYYRPDFIVASPPCEQFSVFGMRHFHPNPPYPDLGIELFNHTRALCEASRVPYVMENVRAAQEFVGKARNNAGSFYLWGSGTPATSKMPNCRKGFRHTEMFAHARTSRPYASATIPPELANCVAEYAERLLEQRKSA